ncbi:MAG: ABC transporter ATP-binding protein [Candidatus Promineifilaceae bacterium]|jgi:ABC-type Fe3+/spermidine/putrescine transport system ATPase subunit
MALLVVESLSKAYVPGQTVVDNVSLAVDEGEIVCLLGPSGCGKTTLLRLITGLEQPDSGEIWFDGRNMAPVPPHEREIGMMFQDFALFPHKNVAENIAFGLKMHGRSQEEINRRVAEMLELVELPGFEQRDVSSLSGGEKQRVALARSLALEPRLLMLDEPLGALDRALRERLMLDLRRILRQLGVTAIYVTHDQTEAYAVSDRIALMNEGHIEQLDAPQNVYYRPATRFAARFLGFRNLLPATVLGPNEVRTNLGDLKVVDTMRPPDSQVTLLIRPDAAQIVESANAQSDNTIAVTVSETSFRGKYSQVWVETGDGESLIFEMPGRPPPLGSSAIIFLNPLDTNVLPA